MTQTKPPDLSTLPPLQTTWRERSRSNTDRVMEEVDAFGHLTGQTRFDTIGRVPVNPRRRVDSDLSTLPADPPVVIYRTRVPWWRVAALSTAIAVTVDIIIGVVK